MSLLGRLSGPSGHTVVNGRAFRRSLPNATTGNVSRTSDTGRWAQRSMGRSKTAVKRRLRIRRPTANDCNRCSLVVRKWPKGIATHRISAFFYIFCPNSPHAQWSVAIHRCNHEPMFRHRTRHSTRHKAKRQPLGLAFTAASNRVFTDYSVVAGAGFEPTTFGL